mmetsp:Transcript_40406/g.67413  ORF Transcript_40406/g.67413 Transcript_40406/m.67413 type:complete len:100 (+) Transcript_40406:250-549(+)
MAGRQKLLDARQPRMTGKLTAADEKQLRCVLNFADGDVTLEFKTWIDPEQGPAQEYVRLLDILDDLAADKVRTIFRKDQLKLAVDIKEHAHSVQQYPQH